MDMNEYKDRISKLKKKSEIASSRMDESIGELRRVADVASNVKTIISDIDAEFERRTSLNNVDVSFLLFAAMLQTIRWVLMDELKLPRIDELEPEIPKGERLDPNERKHNGGIYDGMSSGSEYEHGEMSKYLDKNAKKAKESTDEFYHKKNKFRSWIEIITQPVPYDAMNGLDKKTIPNIANLNKQNPNGTYNNIYAKNHHVATLGHDPILGWIFGTANIMTSTISFVDFQNYRVIRGHKIKSLPDFMPSSELLYSDQAIDYSQACTILEIAKECILSAEEDNKRIAAAVAKQAMHFVSDKYCIEGLPFPILSTINPQKAQDLIEKGWNSVEFEKLLKHDIKQIGISAGISVIINLIIKAIYLLCLKSDDDENIRKVKIEKILSIAGIISSSSNILYVTLTERYSKTDIGGIGVAMLSLLHSSNFIRDIKKEYIANHFEDAVMNGGISYVR